MIKALLYIHLLIAILLIVGCDQQKNNSVQTTKSSSLIKSDSVYINMILSFDTLSQDEKVDRTGRMLNEFDHIKNKDTSVVYNYLKFKWHSYNNQLDSASFYYDKIQVKNDRVDLFCLKQHEDLFKILNSSDIIDYETNLKFLNTINYAEKKKSRLAYVLYNDMARLNYQNRNYEKALHYSNLYFEKTPFKSHPHIQSMYYEIQILLSKTINDIDLMKKSLDEIKVLAKTTDDKLLQARYYDYESQYYSKIENYSQALESNKKSYLFFKKNNGLKKLHINNLALSFLKNNDLDSAIHYYKISLELLKKDGPNANFEAVYGGLRETYQKKGDYKEALFYLDAFLKNYVKNSELIQNQKLEELELTFETNKKDVEIKTLKTENDLKEKVIIQQKWLIIITLLLFVSAGLVFYTIYSRKILKEKNEKLEIENNKFLLEQKTRQMQLNPHFIYNAITNMQGLIIRDEKILANNYLITLSKVIRNMLELNREDYITIGDEISSLSNYLNLQKMRFPDTFNFIINNNNVEPDLFLIPPMILQPFVENSIEHGFKGIKYKGVITINFVQENNSLKVEIHDNGTKLNQTPSLDKKSLSSIITQERLDLLFNKNGQKNAYFTATKLENGFVVNIIIPLINS